MSSPINKDFMFVILQYLRENNLLDSAHSLERESGLFFDMNYFEEMVLAGKLDESEKYLSGFIQIHENMFSTKTYFDIRRQKFLEALDRNERGEALDILRKDIKAFSPYNEAVLKEATLLLFSDNFRQHKSLAKYGDPMNERMKMMIELKQCILQNPAFRGKLLLFPINSTPPSIMQQHHHIMHVKAAAAAAAAPATAAAPAPATAAASSSDAAATANDIARRN